jgi:2-amino-4-hydroxy-6-hydroxymethyldihydropteridine diphosphokinase
MTRAAVALGSNLGDRLESFRFAARALAELGTLISASSAYETAPIGGPEQDPFYNAVVVLDTMLEPRELLDELHRIEAEAGRVREVHWGPRVLDLDLILYGNRRAEGGGMVVPHPRFAERRFVLEPLLEAWPEARTPDGSAVEPLLDEVLDQAVVRLEAWWPEEEVEPSEAAGQESPVGAPREVTGVATFSGRGGWWVVAQLVLVAVVVVFALTFVDTIAAGLWMQILGIALLVLGGVQSGLGLLHLGVSLTPYPEPLELGNLVHGGIYRHVRHPVYGGLTLAMVGIALFQLSWPALTAAVATGVFFWFKAGAEERRLLARYPGYQGYRVRTRARMIPWVI